MKKTSIATVAIDLDGTILDFDLRRWLEEGMDYFGEPKENAIKALTRLRRLGYNILIYTTRINEALHSGYTIEQMRQYVAAVLYVHHIPYDEIWMNKGKPLADYYVDDRAIEFTTWMGVTQKLGIKL